MSKIATSPKDRAKSYGQSPFNQIINALSRLDILSRIPLYRGLRAVVFFLSGVTLVAVWHYTLLSIFALAYGNPQMPISQIQQIDNTNVVTIGHHAFSVFTIFNTTNFYIVPLTGSYLHSHPSINAFVGANSALPIAGVLLIADAVAMAVLSPASKWRPIRWAARFVAQFPGFIFMLLSLTLASILGANTAKATSGMKSLVLAEAGIKHPSTALLANLSVQAFLGFYLLLAVSIVGTLVSLTSQMERRTKNQILEAEYVEQDGLLDSSASQSGIGIDGTAVPNPRWSIKSYRTLIKGVRFARLLFTFVRWAIQIIPML
jgi:hypothetical protein